MDKTVYAEDVAEDVAEQLIKNFGKGLGSLYKLFVLDCISDLGYAISLDFSQKPHLYTNIDDIAKSLSRLQSMIDVDPNLPCKETRAKLYQPIFGSWDTGKTGTENSTFKMLRNKLFEAAASYAENAQPFRFAALRMDVINAIAAPKDHFKGLQGSSLNQTIERTGTIFASSQIILTHDKIMRRFGIDATFKSEESTDIEWPLGELNPNGSKLIYEISSQLKDIAGGIIERQEFVRLQKIAQRGAEAIEMLFDPELETIPDDVKEDEPKVKKLNKFIGNLYAWGRDLGVIGSKRNLSNNVPK